MKNTWRIAAGGASTMVLSCDILGTVRVTAQNYLDDDRAPPYSQTIRTNGHEAPTWAPRGAFLK
jgi:hypothetical protein